MEPNLEPPVIAAGVADDDTPYIEPWRLRLWTVCAALVMAPAFGLLSLIACVLVLTVAGQEEHEWPALVGAVLGGGYFTYRFLRLGWKRGWGESNVALVGWLILASGCGLVGFEVHHEWRKVQAAHQDKLVVKNLEQLAAAETRLFTADREHLFFTYEQVVGPGRLVPELKTVRGENYRSLYPRHIGQTFCLEEKPPHALKWFVLELTSSPGNWTNPRRCNLPGGGRLEFDENQSREPDGPVRIFRADGTIWAEAQCKAGRLIEPATIYGPDGRRSKALNR